LVEKRLHGPDDAAREFEKRVRHLIVNWCPWDVRETVYPTGDRRVGSSLIFESDMRAMRVRTFPVDWFTLADADLWALLAVKY
jgi:hypothetical protein